MLDLCEILALMNIKGLSAENYPPGNTLVKKENPMINKSWATEVLRNMNPCPRAVLYTLYLPKYPSSALSTALSSRGRLFGAPCPAPSAPIVALSWPCAEALVVGPCIAPFTFTMIPRAFSLSLFFFCTKWPLTPLKYFVAVSMRCFGSVEFFSVSSISLTWVSELICGQIRPAP